MMSRLSIQDMIWFEKEVKLLSVVFTSNHRSMPTTLFNESLDVRNTFVKTAKWSDSYYERVLSNNISGSGILIFILTRDGIHLVF